MPGNEKPVKNFFLKKLYYSNAISKVDFLRIEGDEYIISLDPPPPQFQTQRAYGA